LITSPDQVHVSAGSSINEVVYRITATDLDTQGAVADPTEGDDGSVQGPLTYALAPGLDSALFTISDNGEIRFAAPPVFDAVTPANNVKTIVVQASDGAHVTQQTMQVVINEDPGIMPVPLIESNGDFALRSDGSQYLISEIGVVGAPEVGVTLGGQPVGPNSFASGWQAIQAEEAVGGGFHVLWEKPNGDYSFWTTNAAGEHVSSVQTAFANQTPGLYEDIFQVDLDGDGVPPVDFIV
jgi:hypothetical protein